jgi:hypothetical protein
MPKKEDLSLKAIRHMLCSIDLSDIDQDKKELSEADRMAYCSAIFAVFPRIEKDIKELLYEQLMFVNNNAQDWNQVVFGRGTFNGMDLLLEKWRKASIEHEANSKDKKEEKKFDKSNPISEI